MRFLFCIIFFYGLNISAAQNQHIQIIESNKKEGLGQKNLRAGFQCSRGLIWLYGYHGGLHRYDGASFKQYNVQKNGLTSDFITHVEEAPDSLLWITGAMTGEQIQGVDIFNPITEQSVSIQTFFGNQLPYEPSSIYFQKNNDGTIWLYNFYQSPKIYEYDGKKLRLWGERPSSSGGKIHKINHHSYCLISDEIDTEQAIYFYTKNGILTETQALPPQSMYSFMTGWIDSTNASFLVSSRTKKTSAHILTKISRNLAPKVLDSMDMYPGLGYFCTENIIVKATNGQVIFCDEKMQQIGAIPYPYSRASCFFDRQGGIWLSGDRGHLQRVHFNQSPFLRYQCLDTICSRQTRGITEGLEGDLFINLFSGMLHVDKDGSSKRITGNSIGFGPVTGLCLDRKKERLWMADSRGVWQLNPRQIEADAPYYHKTKDGLETSGLWQVFVASTGKLWIGSNKGLLSIQEGDTLMEQFRAYNGFEQLKNAVIYSFHENAKGIWVGSSQGVFLMDAEEKIIAHYHDKGKEKFYLPHKIIAHIQLGEDSKSFWLATKGGGLVHWNFETGAYQQYTTKDGLSDDILYAVYNDDYGNLWLPSNYGLMCFNKETKDVKIYLEENGIPNNEFNTLAHHKGIDGTLYFGGITGPMSFHPKTLVKNKPNASILLSNLKRINYEDQVSTQGLDEGIKGSSILFEPIDKSLTLSFCYTNYNNLEHNRYAYRIEGFDKAWQYLDRPEIKLNGLPYGKYSLVLRAQALGYEWEERRLHLHVVRPFYMEIWFFACLGIFLLFLVWTIIKVRISSLEQRKKELELMVQQRTAQIEASRQKVAKQAEELKALDKVKSRFFANISHELRTPLTLILGPVAGIQSKPFGMLNEKEVRKNLAIVERNSKQLLGLIEEILDLSKLEAQKLQVHEKACLFKHFLQRIFSSFESLAEMQAIAYRFDYNLSNNLKLLVDQDKIERILINFLSNAFKFTTKGCEIVLSVYEKEEDIVLEVQDSGKGIIPEDLPHVFERFFQSKSPLLEAQGGTGIGLALCAELAKLLNGRVWATSKLGEGSQFYFQFPKKEIHAEVEVPSLEDSATDTFSNSIIEKPWPKLFNNKTILLVEDNKDMREFICSLLEQEFQIKTAHNGQEGLALLKSHAQDVDLIISDVMMPIMDGFTMLEQIKANDYWCSLPVIMLTARAAEADKLRALTIGVDDYLTKPFSTEELYARIKNLLQNYEARSLWKQELLMVASDVQQEHIHVAASPKTKKEVKEETTVSKQDLIWLKEVEMHIKTNIDKENFDMEELATAMLLSKRQLERKIKKITGLSPAKLVKEVRLKTAREHLEKGTFRTVAEVSYAVGIQTPSYFAQLYYQRFGKKTKAYFK